MAVTGLIGVGFVIVHMAGNLQVFVGPREDQQLRALPARTARPSCSWLAARRPARRVSCTCSMAYQLTMRSRARRARSATAKREPQVSTLASRTMRWGGVLLLVFIVFHILHFTTGTIVPVASRPDAQYPAFRHTRRLRQRRQRASGSGGSRCSTSSRCCSLGAAPLSRRVELGAHARLREAVARSAAAARRARRSPSSSGSASRAIPLAVLARSDPIDDTSN